MFKKIIKYCMDNPTEIALIGACLFIIGDDLEHRLIDNKLKNLNDLVDIQFKLLQIQQLEIREISMLYYEKEN